MTNYIRRQSEIVKFVLIFCADIAYISRLLDVNSNYEKVTQNSLNQISLPL